jgi:hypothetical protein
MFTLPGITTKLEAARELLGFSQQAYPSWAKAPDSRLPCTAVDVLHDIPCTGLHSKRILHPILKDGGTLQSSALIVLR